MLETFVKELGICYVIVGLCAVGVIAKCYESWIYARLLKAVDNPERTEHPFMKQLKMKYRNYYQLERKVNNTDAFIETSLFRYKHHFIGLESLHTVSNRMMLLCVMACCVGIAFSVYFHLKTEVMVYQMLVGAVALSGLELIEQQFGGESKRRMLLVALKDYLENALSNQLEGRERDMVLEPETDKEKDMSDPAKAQVAITKNIAEKVASELAQEKVIAEVIKEFFP